MYNKTHNINPNWKADNVGNQGLHKWIRSHFYRTRLCQMCMQTSSYDLANITGMYNREFKNWRYYCRKCHMISDGRLQKINDYNRNKGRLQR